MRIFPFTSQGSTSSSIQHQLICKTNMNLSVPTIDLSEIETNEEVLATEVKSALSGIGFMYLKNHGVPQEIIDKAFTQSLDFFQLPTELKSKYAMGGGSGYVAPGLQTLDPKKRLELRESFDLHGKVNFPKECPKLEESLLQLKEESWILAKKILRLIAISLGIEDRNYFVTRNQNADDPTIPGHSSLRSLHYPPLDEDDPFPQGSVRLGEHADWGTITLLYQDNVGGLEVKNVVKDWIPAPPVEGCVLVNTGELLEIWSGGFYPATFHRLGIPSSPEKRRTGRQSIVHFLLPDDEVLVEPLTGSGEKYKRVTSKEYIQAKLNMSYPY